MGSEEQRPFVDELRKHSVEAKVIQFDHYRVHGVMAVRTDFIILVEPKHQQQDDSSSSKKLLSFEPFMISKRYHAFRKFADDLLEASNSFFRKRLEAARTTKKTTTTAAAAAPSSSSPAVMELIQYCESVNQMIDSQPKQYLQRVDAAFVKKHATQRSEILNSVLFKTIQHFPTPTLSKQATAAVTSAVEADELAFQQKVAELMQTFFLTDVCSLEATSNYLNNNNNNKTTTESPPEPAAPAPNTPSRGDKNPFKQFLDPITSNLNKIYQQQQSSSQDETTTTTTAATTKPRKGFTIVPLTMRERRSDQTRQHDERELAKASASDQGLILEPEHTVTVASPVLAAPAAPAAPAVVVKASAFENLDSTWLWVSIVIMAVALLSRAKKFVMPLPVDLELLLLFSAYCFGLHTPRVVRSTSTTKTTKTKPAAVVIDPTGRKLMKRSTLMTKAKTKRFNDLKTSTAAISAQKGLVPPDDKEVEAMLMVEQEEEEEEQGTPMTEFPAGAELGSVTNCWGKSHAEDFKVRGPNYFTDKKKLPSKDFILPVRGVELLLTDTCPSNVGRNTKLLRGTLRDVPTFILNFRLPWAVLLCYFEIPKKFIPYLQLSSEPEAISAEEKDKLEAALETMGPGERCACRYFMKSVDHKNKNLKIVPVVVKGPWVVRQVVDGKPGIIGTKLPMEYTYQKHEGPGKALYWEADLDICASSAARGILSVVRSYTQILTLDLGFVVQGNTDEELPEQMLVGVRLHGVDPMTAPAYPELIEDSPFAAEPSLSEE